jgi:hypothetical protein
LSNMTEVLLSSLQEHAGTRSNMWPNFYVIPGLTSSSAWFFQANMHTRKRTVHR